MFKFKSIKTRLVFWFIIAGIIPLAIGIISTYLQRVESLRQREFEHLGSVGELKHEVIVTWLEERWDDISVVSSDFEIRSLENLTTGVFDSEEDKKIYNTARELLNRYKKTYQDYIEIFIADPATGEIVVSTNDNQLGRVVAGEDYFVMAVESGELSTSPARKMENGRIGLIMSVPVLCLSHNEHVVGILVAVTDMENSLFPLLSSRKGLGNTGESLIIDSNMYAVSHLRWQADAPLNFKISAEPARRAVNGEKGVIEDPDYRGVPVLAAYSHIDQMGWGLVTKVDRSEAYASIKSMTFSLLIFMLFCLLLIVLIAIYISRSITRPLLIVRDHAEKIIGGDLESRSNYSEDDEVGYLAMTFDNLVESLSSRIKIEQNIRTLSMTLIEKSSIRQLAGDLLNVLMQISGSQVGALYLLNQEGTRFDLLHSIGLNSRGKRSYISSSMDGEMGLAIARRDIIYTSDIPADTRFGFLTVSGEIMPRETITIPLVDAGEITAILSMASIYGYNNLVKETLSIAWNYINSSYSRVINNEKVIQISENLSRAYQTLEAQAEELQEQAEELQSQTEELQEQTQELEAQNLRLDIKTREANEANRLKSEFLSNMSHELRTPLNSILSLSRVLVRQAEERLEKEEAAYLEIIERNGRNLLRLINEILDLSRIESGKIELYPRVVSVASLLDEVSMTLMPLATDKNISLQVTAPDDLPEIVTDRERLGQVITNVMHNAVKFTEEGGVTVTAYNELNGIAIQFADTGVGISREAMASIFDEFRQADGSSSRKYEGTGLGLAIVKNLIRILGGKIAVTSKLNEGSVFIITLPLRMPFEDNGEEKPSPAAPDTKEPDKLEPGISGIKEKKKTLMIVEDNPDAVIQIESLLKSKGYNIIVANGGKEALEIVKTTIPDGIILDLMMPEVDGFEVLEMMRKTETTSSVPVLILTAKDLNAAELERLSSNKIKQLVFKGDVDPEMLLKQLEAMIS